MHAFTHSPYTYIHMHFINIHPHTVYRHAAHTLSLDVHPHTFHTHTPPNTHSQHIHPHTMYRHAVHTLSLDIHPHTLHTYTSTHAPLGTMAESIEHWSYVREIVGSNPGRVKPIDTCRFLAGCSALLGKRFGSGWLSVRIM